MRVVLQLAPEAVTMGLRVAGAIVVQKDSVRSDLRSGEVADQERRSRWLSGQAA